MNRLLPLALRVAWTTYCTVRDSGSAHALEKELHGTAPGKKKNRKRTKNGAIPPDHALHEGSSECDLQAVNAMPPPPAAAAAGGGT
jgi:hypothetical protein